MGSFKEELCQFVREADVIGSVVEEADRVNPSFDRLFELVREGRNAAVHEGAFARHLARHAVRLSLIVEDALMSKGSTIADFMVSHPLCAAMWQPVGYIRQQMLANSFSFLPVRRKAMRGPWWLVADVEVARFLRAEGKNPAHQARRTLEEVVRSRGMKLLRATTYELTTPVSEVLRNLSTAPIVVIAPASDEIVGIVSPFDLL